MNALRTLYSAVVVNKSRKNNNKLIPNKQDIGEVFHTIIILVGINDNSKAHCWASANHGFG